MTSWRTWMTLALMVLSLGFLTASDTECEDINIEWPSFGYHNDCGGDCGGYYYYEAYDCGPWC